MKILIKSEKCFLLLLPILVNAKFTTEDEFKHFILTEYETNLTESCYNYNIASWEFNTDIENSTKEDVLGVEGEKYSRNARYFYNNYFKYLNKLNLTKEWSKRHAKQLSLPGDSVLSSEEIDRMTDIENEMLTIYSNAKVCPYNRKICSLEMNGLPLDPDIETIMASSEDVKELAYFWYTYRSQLGSRIKPLFKEYVALKNKVAKFNNYSDAGEAWRSEYETRSFEKVVENLWSEVKPLYNELHFYVLHKLADYYGDKINVSDGLIPAHITGDIHSHTWTNLISKVIPFPEDDLINITSALISQKYTPLKMFQSANEFYKSLGLEDMSMAFGKKALIEKPDRAVSCHPTAWEFCVPDDFRISMCTKVTHSYFFMVYHELGHVQYYLQYKNQPITFRDAPNPGFHEAIGDSMVLSAMSSHHLKKIRLLDERYKINSNNTVNNLMFAALSYVTVLPYALILDKWRWGIFKGTIDESNWNESWWTYRKLVQKIKPPVSRSTRDFDPASKYHVPADAQYISYFISIIVEFQIYRALCIIAGQFYPDVPFTTPLHECDFHNSTEVGDRLKAGLQLGSSVHWSKVLKLITGESRLSTKAILEYFKPLMEFLVEANKNTRQQKNEEN